MRPDAVAGGLIIDTGVLIRIEREPAAVDFSRYKPAYGEGFISAATCSELLISMHLANTERRMRVRYGIRGGSF